MENWGAEQSRQPTLKDDDTLLYSEHGRVLNNVCYRSHWFKLVKAQYGPTALLVKHGGGEERIENYNLDLLLPALEKVESDNRYRLLYAVYRTHIEAKRKSADETAQTYRKAFVEGRLRSRKLPAQGKIKIWIESEKVTA